MHTSIMHSLVSAVQVMKDHRADFLMEMSAKDITYCCNGLTFVSSIAEVALCVCRLVDVSTLNPCSVNTLNTE